MRRLGININVRMQDRQQLMLVNVQRRWQKILGKLKQYFSMYLVRLNIFAFRRMNPIKNHLNLYTIQ